MAVKFIIPNEQTHKEEMNAISVQALTKTYYAEKGNRQVHALKSVDLDIPRGCIFGLLGPNGAGKSTFINILAGTVIKTSGQVNVWGSDLDKQPRQLRANIGIVPQELNIDVYFTPRELLEFTAGMYAVPRAERCTDDLLKLIGLEDQSDSYARTLSGGMRRRLLIGKALVHQPPVLILDEPTAGVDVALRRHLWEVVRGLNEAGVTIVLTTHYLEEAQNLCDHIAIFNHGKLIASKSKTELLKSAAQKDLMITLSGGVPATLPPEITDLNPRIDQDIMTIRFNPEKTSAGHILAVLAKADISVGDVSTHEPDLEDIFIDITGEDDKHSG